jgi:small-conductance mechanosensitive channel
MQQFLEQWLYDPTVNRLLIAAVALLIVIVVIRFIHRTIGRRIQDMNTRYRVRKLTTFLGYILAIVVLVTVFSDKLGGLHIALGVVGAGVAFALQEVIMSVAGWFAIIFSHFYKTGDRILLGGVKGDVIDIGILRTTVMEIGEWVNGDLYNGRVVRVANSFVFKEPVFNYSGDFPFLWDEITIPVKYGSDYQVARQLFENAVNDLVGEYAHNVQKSWDELVRKFHIEDARVVPVVTMTANENWITFTVRYAVDYRKRRSTKNQLFVRILDEIKKTDGKVVIASTSMEISLFNAADTSGKGINGDQA